VKKQFDEEEDAVEGAHALAEECET